MVGGTHAHGSNVGSPVTAFLVGLSLLPALFAPRPGWHVGHGRVHACPGVSASQCVQATSWASTIRWRGCRECLPHETIAALPPDGIALQVTMVRERPLVARRTLRWPPLIRARDVTAGFEGVPRRYGVYQLFGRARPTARQLAAANAELQTVRLRR
jgi:hypothetical protein